MSEFSDWQNFLDLHTRISASEGKLQDFFRVRNDNSRRVQTILDDRVSRDALIRWTDKYLKPEKSVSASLDFKETGNSQFAQKNYISSIKFYTNSILSCPPRNKNEISIAYANRSAALFQLELFADCIADIDSALNHSYPAHLLPKILIRKVKSLKNLGKTEDCEIVSAQLDEAMKNLQLAETKTGKTQELLKEVKNLSNRRLNISEGTSKENVQTLTEVPILLYGENSLFKHASSALDIRYSDDKGRYVITNQDIKAGDTLFVEPPNAWVVLPDFHESRCHHCTKELTQRYPCLQCGSTWYCSNACRSQSWAKYHSIECGLIPVLELIGIAHLGIRIAISFGLKEVLAHVNSEESLTKLPGVDSPYITSDYPTVYHLVSHTEKMAAEELYQYSFTAALLTLLLERHSRFFEDEPESSCFVVGGLILNHICQMVSNAHAITELCTFEGSNPSTVNERQERIATAIYPSASLMNHSCNPTVINSFQGNRLVVRAIKDVKKGGEIFNCYGPHYRRMRRSERLEALEAQYSFTCQCQSCLDTDTEDFQDLINSFRCPSCQGSLISPNGSKSSSASQQARCRSCNSRQDYFPQLEADMLAMTHHFRGVTAMEAGDMTTAIEVLNKCVELRCTALYKAHPDLGNSADKLAQCYAFVGMYEECEKFLRISLTAVEEQFGRYSIELAHELNKFTDVLLELAKDRRDLSIVHDLKSHLDNASLIYQIHYGAWSSNFKEIVQKKDRVAVLESGIQSQSRK